MGEMNVEMWSMGRGENFQQSAGIRCRTAMPVQMLRVCVILDGKVSFQVEKHQNSCADPMIVQVSSWDTGFKSCLQFISHKIHSPIVLFPKSNVPRVSERTNFRKLSGNKLFVLAQAFDANKSLESIH